MEHHNVRNYGGIPEIFKGEEDGLKEANCLAFLHPCQARLSPTSEHASKSFLGSAMASGPSVIFITKQTLVNRSRYYF